MDLFFLLIRPQFFFPQDSQNHFVIYLPQDRKPQTMKGVKYARIYGAGLRLIFAIVALYYSIQCVIKYSNHEIGTRVNFVPTGDAVFPAMTLCWKLGYKKSVLEHYTNSKSQAKVIDEGQFPTNITMVQFMNESRFALNEFLLHIKVKTLSKIAGKYDHTLWDLATDSNNLTWEQVAMKEEGLCHSTTIPGHIATAGIHSINFGFYVGQNLKMLAGTYYRNRGWKVILHHQGQMKRGTSLTIGTTSSEETYVAIAHSIFKKLQNSKDCDSEMNQGYDSCWTKAIRRKVKSSINCIFPWNKAILKDDDEDILCRDAQLYQSNVEEMVNAELRDVRTNSTCSVPCEVMTFSAAIPSVNELKGPDDKRMTKESRLTIKFNEEIRVTNEFYVYDALSMVGEAGGYLGLFLGISCYHFLKSGMAYVFGKS